jgi:O-antigen/teichoic acid export membrane protein
LTASDPYSQRAVRSNFVAFLLGRGTSALLTFAAFALAARTLPLGDYGSYVAILAILELALALGTGGLDWVATRVIPEYRLHAGGARLVRAVVVLGVVQVGLLVVAAGVVKAISHWLLSVLHVPAVDESAALLWILVLVEGIGRLSRDQMLSVLMCQRLSQIAQVFRAGALASSFALVWLADGSVTTSMAIRFEMLAGAIAACVGSVLLGLELRRLRALPVPEGAWAPPSRQAMWRLARHSYQSYLLVLAYGPQTLTMVITRVLGVDAAAAFGFARGFADQVRRYLPTDLFQGLLRPALVAFYSRAQDVDGLMMRLALWFKCAIAVLFPVLLFFATFGREGATLIGGAKFAEAWPLVVGLLLGAGMMACRRVVELACNMVHASDACVRASLWLLAVPPAAVVLLVTTRSVLSVVALIVGSEAAFCVLAMRDLRRRGLPTRAFDVRGAARLALALSCCVVLLTVAKALFAPSWVAGMGCVLALWPVALRVSRLLEATEVNLVTTLVPGLAGWLGRK